MELQGLDKVIIKSSINRQNGLVIGINHNAYFIEPRGSMFQPLSNGVKIIRITKRDIENKIVDIEIHPKIKNNEFHLSKIHRKQKQEKREEAKA